MTQAFNLSQFANKLNTSGQASLTTAVTGTLPVANGGTGATTLTANNVLLGNGTSALQAVAPGTSGNALVSNGSTWTSAAVPGLGSGQTWQDVTGSRSGGTTYTNTTGKPICVSVYSAWPTRNNQEATVNGVIINHWGIENNYAASPPFIFVVQNGATYSVNFTVGAWCELR